MSKKYHSAAPPAIVTNDLFLAAFLSTVGCPLDRIEKNERRRVSFVFMGDRCRVRPPVEKCSTCTDVKMT